MFGSDDFWEMFDFYIRLFLIAGFIGIVALDIFIIKAHFTGLAREEGSSRLQDGPLTITYCSFSVVIGLVPLPLSILLEALAIWIIRYFRSDAMLAKEERKGKIYFSTRSTDELQERFAYMTDEEKEEWYQAYLKRVKYQPVPAASIIKKMLICWGITALLRLLTPILLDVL